MKLKIIKYALLLVSLGLVFCLLLCSCSPAKRLKRLVRLHPELLQSDTIKSVVSFTIPGQRHDTTIYLDTSTAGLKQIIDRYALAMDSLSKLRLTNQIHNYITERPVLLDTVYIPLQNGGYVKIFPSGKSKLGHKLFEPAQAHRQVLSTAVHNTYKDIPWRLPWYWLIVVFACGIFITLLFRSKK